MERICLEFIRIEWGSYMHNTPQGYKESKEADDVEHGPCCSELTDGEKKSYEVYQVSSQSLTTADTTYLDCCGK